ncbi:GerMN domain-containing protein [Sporolactobacillus putidus]|uniref:Spore germination protein GerM n=1 Tax=Sporolactobacillus putidus TaxID=492735 RepID=A0A917RX56_9BACL|nr:GerMN domain-containing protein [Sporolactobacillus putidus]GGL41690.1 spore germination protein GerM [Sporolactobacillus putidus]
MLYRRSSVMTAAVMLAFMALLAGCGTADRQPSSVQYVKSPSELNRTANNLKSVQRELYLSDANGFLAPQTIALPASNAPAKQVLDYLAQDGPVTDLLPNGFQAILPAGTIVKSVSLDQQGLLTADFSRELLDAPAGDQDKIVQSVVWTLTQFDTVKKVTIRVNGRILNEWPGSKKPVGQGLTRSDGINETFGGVADVADSVPATVYYLSSNKGKSYDVPVTVRMTQAGSDDLYGLVNTLIHEPAGSAFISTFSPETELVEKPVVKNGVVYLHFNDALYANKESKTISDDAFRCLVLTLTGEKGIRLVSIKVGSSDKVMLESGKTIAGPVSRSMVSPAGL